MFTFQRRFSGNLLVAAMVFIAASSAHGSPITLSTLTAVPGGTDVSLSGLRVDAFDPSRPTPVNTLNFQTSDADAIGAVLAASSTVGNFTLAGDFLGLDSNVSSVMPSFSGFGTSSVGESADDVPPIVIGPDSGGIEDPTPIPEPGTLLLITGGVVGLLARPRHNWRREETVVLPGQVSLRPDRGD